MRAALVLVGLALLAACDRTPLGLLKEFVDGGARTPEVPPPDAAQPDAAPDRSPDLAPDGPPDAAPDRPADLAPPPAPPAPPAPAVPGCQPREETCNGADDDCDGKVDEDLPAVPCPNGGSRYCVAGRMSECPRACDVCRPGSKRVCFISYCTYWGTQTCAADGRSFGLCRETPVPPECAAVAKSKKRSPELQRCCVDNGYCCLDEFDLDGDGDRGEMLGRCGGVACTP